MEKTVQERVVHLARKKNILLITAESLTAGLISATIAEVSGASSVLFGGLVTYMESAKTHVLGVDHDLIKTHGVVSEKVAYEMAERALDCLATAMPHKNIMSIAVTGLAGPDGGSEQTPIGTVYVGLGMLSQSAKQISTDKLFFTGSRNEIRKKTVDTVLEKIYLTLQHYTM